MKEPSESIGLMDLVKQSLLSSGKRTERAARHLTRQLSPAAIVHHLRWRAHSREFLAQWTADRLQLGDDYWLFVLGLNNSGTTLVVDLLKSHPSMRWLPNEGQ